MKKGTKIALGVAVVAILSYPAIAGLTGLMVKSSMQNNEERLLDQTPYLTVLKREYQGGIYKATQTVTYGIGQKFLDALGGKFGSNTPLQFTIHSTIHHGPFPAHSSFGMSTIDSELVLPEAAQRKLNDMLKGRSPLQMHTQMGWLGSAVTKISSPPFEKKGTETRPSFAWQGLTATLASGRNLSSLAGELSILGMEIQDAKAQAAIRDVHATFDMESSLDALYVGTSDFNIGTIEFKPASVGRALSLHGLKMAGKSSLDSDFYDAGAQLAADSLQVADFSVTKPVYALSFEHIHAPSLAALMKEIQNTMREPNALAASKGKMSEAVSKHGYEILLNNPALDLQHIGFTMPEGELKLSGKLLIQGLKREELEGPMGFMAIAKKAVATFDFTIDETLATKLAGSSGKGETMTVQIENLQAQGYLTREHGKLLTRIEYSNGQTKINGKPFSAAALRSGQVPRGDGSQKGPSGT